ncbi:hypothetical protein [Natronohydrobacter thiooxidans]|uniref:hypothetical protein n=1 Tax=Natronohydrobacter thiooxidans TaxID=87172 RepID=UPI001114936D|nr:hypothetical protein [Natronohydrobacter thiooxidans]
MARVLGLLLWIAAGLGFAALADFETMDPLTLAALTLACFMPAVVITLGLLVAAATWSLSHETRHLQGSIDELRQSLLQRETGTATAPVEAAGALSDLKAAQAEAETELAMFFSQRRRPEATAPAPVLPEQSAMFSEGENRALGALPATDELIRALNFPENEHDAAGFAAMRVALADPRLSPLIRAAQDVLTRLAQEGIYMDDLRPDRARPEFWRAFAHGTRGALIAPLGGIRDRSCLAITSGRMRSDPEFRAAVHLFLREFDRVFAQMEAQADDSQITAFSDTRTARAFMLLGRVSGVFSR